MILKRPQRWTILSSDCCFDCFHSLIPVNSYYIDVCKGDEAEDDDHGLALHLPHLEHLHLPQGELCILLFFIIIICHYYHMCISYFPTLTAQDLNNKHLLMRLPFQWKLWNSNLPIMSFKSFYVYCQVWWKESIIKIWNMCIISCNITRAKNVKTNKYNNLSQQSKYEGDYFTP